MGTATNKIRNLGFFGHSGTGKTSLMEAILFTTGQTTRLGRIEDGNTTTDYEPDEIKRKTTINSKIASFNFKDYKVNLLDTPGYADFIGEVLSVLPAVDGMVFFVSASAGVEIATRKLWKAGQEAGKPKFIFINKIEKENIDLEKVLEGIKKSLSPHAVLVVAPLFNAGKLAGLADLIKMKAYLLEDGRLAAGEIPAEFKEKIGAARTELVEKIAEEAEDLLDKYLSSGGLSEEEFLGGLKKAVLAGDIVPVFAGSAGANLGTEIFLENLLAIAPAPFEGSTLKGLSPETGAEVTPKPEAPFSALIFKVISDPGVGEISFFRIFSGTAQAGQDVFNPNKKNRERLGGLLTFCGKKRSEIIEAPAGDIVAVAKLKNTALFDTLCDEKNKVIFPGPKFPGTVVSVAIHPSSKKDQEKLGAGLSKITATDPTFHIRMDQEFGETVVLGMGEIHIEVVIERLKERFGIEMTSGKPKIPYRETIKASSKCQGKYKKQTGGRGQYGDVWLEIKPLKHGQGFEFINKLFGGSIPVKYVPSIEKGVKEAMKKGVLAGYPVADISVMVYDGSYHDVDSSDIAFQIAGSMALKKGLQEARPVLLEPIVNVEVLVPDQYMGDVTGDLNSRRGRILGIEAAEDMQMVKALVPLAEMDRYSTDLRSFTRGAGTYAMTFSHYEEVPALISKKIIEESQKNKEAKEEEK